MSWQICTLSWLNPCRTASSNIFRINIYACPAPSGTPPGPTLSCLVELGVLVKPTLQWHACRVSLHLANGASFKLVTQSDMLQGYINPTCTEGPHALDHCFE